MIGVAGQKRVPEHFVLDYQHALPHAAVQRATADFLDEEISRIDSLVTSRVRTLALLEERARTVISTRLLSPGASSPEAAEWESSERPLLLPLRRVATIHTGLTVDDSRVDGTETVTRPYLRVANVQDGYLALEDLTEIAVSPRLAARCELRPGDVLMTEGGDLDKLGRGTVWPGTVPGCLHQNHVFAVRPHGDKLDSAYLALVTSTHRARAYFESTGTRTTNLASTNASKIGDFPIPLRPLSLQRALVTTVHQELECVTTARRAVQAQMTLLRERRQALITAAVTGQIDVGGAA